MLQGRGGMETSEQLPWAISLEVGPAPRPSRRLARPRSDTLRHRGCARILCDISRVVLGGCVPKSACLAPPQPSLRRGAHHVCIAMPLYFSKPNIL